MTCSCDVCKQSITFREHLDRIPAELHEYFQELYDVLIHAQFDNDYYKAIIDGSWPEADLIIDRARKRKVK